MNLYSCYNSKGYGCQRVINMPYRYKTLGFTLHHETLVENGPLPLQDIIDLQVTGGTDVQCPICGYPTNEHNLAARCTMPKLLHIHWDALDATSQTLYDTPHADPIPEELVVNNFYYRLVTTMYLTGGHYISLFTDIDTRKIYYYDGMYAFKRSDTNAGFSRFREYNFLNHIPVILPVSEGFNQIKGRAQITIYMRKDS